MDPRVTAEQVAWIDSALADLGRERTGPVETFRREPWATVATLTTCAGPIWFKANESCFGHEARLIALLDAIAPASVQCPIAWDEHTGWFLTEDGGPTAGEADGLSIAAVYTNVQLASAEVVPEMLDLGVQDRRPDMLGTVFENACAHPEAGAAGPQCASLRSRFDATCDVLAADGRAAIADSDLGPHHAFIGPPLRLFDWADAVVTHPLVAAYTLGRQLTEGQTAAARLAAAWGVDPGGAVARSASVIACLLAADVWMRVPPASWERHPGGIERWVRRLADALAATEPSS